MPKQKFKITNWKTYNHALRQRGLLTVWVSDDSTAAWYGKAQPERRARLLRYTDTAITTALMLKSVFHLTQRALQGFIQGQTKALRAMGRVYEFSPIPLQNIGG